MKFDGKSFKKISSFWILITWTISNLKIAELTILDKWLVKISCYYFSGAAQMVFSFGLVLLVLMEVISERDFKISEYLKKPWIYIIVSLLVIRAFYEMTYDMNHYYYVYNNIIVNKYITYYLIYVFLAIYVVLKIIEWVLVIKERKY